MPPAARFSDPTAHGAIAGPCSPNTFINGLGACRAGDLHSCLHGIGAVAPGSASVIINGSPASRVADPALCPVAPDVIAVGSPNVLVGG